MKTKNNSNADIRKALIDRGIRHYEAAEACGVSVYTFTHWLQCEMKPEKKAAILEALNNLKR